MGKVQLLKGIFLTFCGGALAMAGTVCPAGNGSNPFPHNPDGTATGCNVVITIASSGTATTSVKDTTPYENSEDVLVGVVNNSSAAVSVLNVSGAAGSGIFGFDGDGICTFTFVGSTYCSTAQVNGTDPGDYQGPTSTFSNISGSTDSGTVNFSPAIPANGGTTYFSLEGLPAATISATTGPTPTPGAPSSTPAPSTLLLTLTAIAGMGIYFMSRRFANR
jgi:hypothetical protein